jgi:amino-acid N-acetyltransferase
MKVADLRGILQYVPRFRDRTFVVAVDGEIVAASNFTNILLDLAVLRSLSIRIILVHGAGFQIRQMAADRSIAISSADGTGVIDDTTLKLSLEAATNVLNEIMQGLTAVDLRAAYANVIIAHPAGILGGVDHQHAGRVERVDTQALEFFLSQGIIPLIPPLGFDGEGRTFRVNSDGIAVEVAEAMRAMKIIFLTGEDGLVVNGDFIRQLSVAEAEEFARKRRALVAPKLLSKLDHAARACRQGVPRVHLLNGNVNEALLAEVFSPDGIGTMVYSNEYQQIRRVFKKDVRAVMALIRQSVDSEELVRRTRADILAHLEDYWVLEIDRNLIGCVAVHLYPEARKAELACLYIAKNQEGLGYGSRMMAFAERLAAERGMTHLFALSTQAFNYFQQKGGFQPVSPDALPPERRKKYDASGRNSKVLEKKLAPLPGASVAAPRAPEPALRN